MLYSPRMNSDTLITFSVTMALVLEPTLDVSCFTLFSSPAVLLLLARFLRAGLLAAGAAFFRFAAGEGLTPFFLLINSLRGMLSSSLRAAAGFALAALPMKAERTRLNTVIPYVFFFNS